MLSIYKASAGSGKTHSLSREYLKLLFSADNAYKHILAVTFTNKATDEMKRRIVEELDNLSDPEKESDFLEEISSLHIYSKDPKENQTIVRAKAKQILITILHDYSAFSISTIDKFFQQTMRAFAREIGKNSSYSVEIDQSYVLEQAIDQMIVNLDRQESEELLNWLILYSFENVEDGGSWDIRKGIYSLAGQLFKEAFKINKGSIISKLKDKSQLDDFRKQLDEIIDLYENKLKLLGKRAIQIIVDNSLHYSDFAGASKSPFFFLPKLSKGYTGAPTKTFVELYDNPEAWYSKSLKKSSPSKVDKIEELARGELNDIIGDIISTYENGIDYNTAVEIKRNFYTLGILFDIEKYIQEYSSNNNVVLLSETTELLNKIIDGSDTPFIYEKIGNRLDHFMLDEFQDTSLMQWQNFRPLLQNSLASGNDNLIVGDVKQSIYRWRGSEWNLLNKDIYSDFDPTICKDFPLQDNWRSASEIIEFNNEFFPYAAQLADQILGESNSIKIEDVYSTTIQTLPKSCCDKQGHVRLQFIGDNDNAKWSETAINQIPDILSQIFAKGYQSKDIAFLVRRNSEAFTIASFLIKNKYQVISDDALLVCSSKSVALIISILNYYNNPEDKINITIAEFGGLEIGDDLDIKQLSLYEMCEHIIKKYFFDIDESESVFVQAFLDLVVDYIKSFKADLSSFLEWWKGYGIKKNISSPDDQNAIKVMTIHKSKGLGMSVVILPFLDIGLEPSNNHYEIIWCKTTKEPFNQIPYVPVKYGKSLESTIFSADYKFEKLKSYIDNLNTAYVAFTRAKNEMIIIAKKPKINQKGDYTVASISDILYKKYSNQCDENGVIAFGDWTTPRPSKKNSIIETPFPSHKSIPFNDRVRLSLKSQDFFDQTSRRGYGLIMHDILSRVLVKGDLKQAIEHELREGVIEQKEFSGVMELLERLLASVEDRDWFTGRYKVLTEIEVIQPGGATYRPDRILLDIESETNCQKAIVIDFKFGQKQTTSHIRQVSKYISLIREIGISSVTGFLWYLEDNEIVEVNI